MTKRRWLRLAAITLVAPMAADLALSRAMRIGRVQRYLTARLESAFGRPVQVGHFALRLVPSPRIEAESVTVGEDPAFGYEYFLRADRVTAGLRWRALLRGRFELGTFSFTRPSLTLVRNEEGRWNLERWLPPAHRNPVSSASFVGPMPPPASALRLARVEFDDGRVNFMNGSEKLPFAFTDVDGRVEQEAPGRWKLRLEAKPWRSGTTLQAAGTLFVRGEIAGTSARLQPAEIHLHWGQASLADLVRLALGEDYGIRGAVILDAVARSTGLDSATVPTGNWAFSIRARAREIHRWDLTERRDNPAVNVLLDGIWNVPTGSVRVKQLVVEGPGSNARGEAALTLSGKPSFEVHANSAGIQAADALAWYRAFHPGVAEKVSAEGFLTGAAAIRGWPLEFTNVAFSSKGGALTAPGLQEPLQFSAFEGGRTRDRLVLDPVKIPLATADGPSMAAGVATGAFRGHKRPPTEETDSAILSASHDLLTGAGYFSVVGSTSRAEDVLAIAAALGRSLQRGWELEGRAAASLRWDWGSKDRVGTRQPGGLNGYIDLSKSRLQVAGLNLPLELNDAQLVWKDAKRSVHLGSVEGFGAEWDGDLDEDQPLSSVDTPRRVDTRGWKFRLHADHVNAAELDRWVGPRARPNWLERLLPSLLGTTPESGALRASASELMRRIHAEGELRVDKMLVERLQLSEVQATAALHDFRLDVREATARWAGGAVRGSLTAEFAPRPRYGVDATFDRVHLAELPGAQSEAERFAGLASGELHIATEGVGRGELFRTLEGGGRVRLRNVELRGWDVAASLEGGAPHAGASRWLAGEGAIAIRDGAISLRSVRLDSPQGPIEVRGTIQFGRGTDLTFAHAVERPPARAFERTSAGRRASVQTEPLRVLKITGPLDVPRVSVETRSF